MRYTACCVLFLMVFVSGLLSGDEVISSESRAGLDKVIQDYIGLYQRETLDEWKKLFHPSVMVFFPADDGTINARNLDEFFQRQQNYFNTRKSVSERLENLQIFEGKRIARVVANYVFIDEGKESSGKLGLHLAEGDDGWKIVSVLFSYN